MDTPVQVRNLRDTVDALGKMKLFTGVLVSCFASIIIAVGFNVVLQFFLSFVVGVLFGTLVYIKLSRIYSSNFNDLPLITSSSFGFLAFVLTSAAFGVLTASMTAVTVGCMVATFAYFALEHY